MTEPSTTLILPRERGGSAKASRRGGPAEVALLLRKCIRHLLPSVFLSLRLNLVCLVSLSICPYLSTRSLTTYLYRNVISSDHSWTVSMGGAPPIYLFIHFQYLIQCSYKTGSRVNRQKPLFFVTFSLRSTSVLTNRLIDGSYIKRNTHRHQYGSTS